MSEAKFSPLLRHVRHTQLRRMDVQRDPQWVLDLAAERDTLRAEVERLTLHVVKAQQHALDMENKAFELAAREVEFFAEVEQLRQQAARYERLRRLNPRQFAELHQRNLAGERFDDLVDAL